MENTVQHPNQFFENPRNQALLQQRAGDRLHLLKVRNARTYRNVQTTDGRYLRDNVLVRMARLTHATPADLAQLRDVGVTAVVDLRLPNEAAAAPDLRLPGWQYVPAPTASDKVTPGMPLPELFDYLKDHDDALDQMRNGYRGIVADPEQQASLRAAVNAVLTTPGATAFHCSMGKDRTGVFAALMLSVAGVDRHFIDADYMYSNVSGAAHIQALRQKFADWGGDARMQNQIDYLASTSTAYLDAMFDWVRNNYGDAAGFVADGLGFGHDGVIALRHKLIAE